MLVDTSVGLLWSIRGRYVGPPP